MQLIRDPDNLPDELRHGAVSIGKFDGVHRGHAEIIDRLVRHARKINGPAIALTFDPLPIRVLRPDHAPLPMSWIERKAELLGNLGVDAVVAYPTTRDFLQLDARAFFDLVLREQLAARAVVEGYNFCFGRDRQGDVYLLDQMCRESGIEMEVVPAILTDGHTVSSSRIRQHLLDGQIQQVNSMLTEPLRMRGVVIKGDQRGRELGYPTANLQVLETMLPGKGVYAARAWHDGRAWPAAIALGPNPTFSIPELKIEVHLIGFEGHLYHETLEVELLAKLRDLVRFDSIDLLIEQLKQDTAQAAQIVGRLE